ncbi:MAG: hypothetical protein GOU98_01395 [Candidatus Altiarchaeota archaeon]|nr:hypothetical protein [Candidatus Altiarchaeota archaeon]
MIHMLLGIKTKKGFKLDSIKNWQFTLFIGLLSALTHSINVSGQVMGGGTFGSLLWVFLKNYGFAWIILRLFRT